MKQVLLATNNPAKIKYYGQAIERLGVCILSPKDVGVQLDIDEDGLSSTENAVKKAKAYAKASNMTTIAIDDGLIIDRFSPEKQPGTNVRRINGRPATDDEMIEYYTSEIKKLGGCVKGRWIKSVAVALSEDDVQSMEYIVEKLFTSRVSLKRNEGYPLDSISITPQFNKFTSELSEEEIKILQDDRDRRVFEFIRNYI
jgi:XTP/dITP diphosphohydrolase